MMFVDLRKLQVNLPRRLGIICVRSIGPEGWGSFVFDHFQKFEVNVLSGDLQFFQVTENIVSCIVYNSVAYPENSFWVPRRTYCSML
jgi:hypothetical protein